MDYKNGKRHALAFRRWMLGKSPSKFLVDRLEVKSREAYEKFFSQFVGIDPFQTYAKEWQIDHICPLHLFSLDEVGLAWSQENLRPLTIRENKAKGGSLIEALKAIEGRIEKHPQNETLKKLRQKLLDNLSKEWSGEIVFYS